MTSYRERALSERRLVLPGLGGVYAALSPAMEPLLRVTVGLLLVPHGAQKLFGWFGGHGLGPTAEFLASVGYQPRLLWALTLGLLEFGGGILLALGLLTRPVALAIAAFMANAVIFHWHAGFFWADGGIEYPLLWGITALFFAVRGGGAYALDARLPRAF